MTTEPAWAKVNLFLHVVGRRADGYHLLDSLAVFPAVGDRLRVRPAPELTLAIEGRFGDVLTAEPDNLVLRAARALAASCGIRSGASIVLEKNLPVASGIGGGSADAAAALRALQPLWRMALDDTRLASIAQSLGADVPVCLASQPARMQGIGEILKPAPMLPDCGMVLVNPGVAVSTPEVFRARAPGFTPEAILPDFWLNAAALAETLRGTRNDLEPPAIALCPVIDDVLAALRAESGCLLARMSGSGATCFALFPTASQAVEAARHLARPGWWSWGGAMRANGSSSSASFIPVGLSDSRSGS